MHYLSNLFSRKTAKQLVAGLALMASSAIGQAAYADTMLVEKQTFTTHDYKTVNGKSINTINIGWEAYGKLNAQKDNVILITHFFSGNSHAAGKYKTTDPLPGYWDAIIGPGKAIDTDKYFVISSDTLVNASAYDPNVITTGPATINPDTGKPWGLDFPVVTIRDFVEVQKRLLDSLGIKKLHAVVGASMGSFQALEWSVAYPDMVERMASVIGAGKMDPWTVSALEQWAIPIKLDKHWNNGDYYGKTLPMDGLAATLGLITQTAMHPIIFNASHPGFNNWEQGPRANIRDTFSVSKWLDTHARTRAKLQDANHILYLVRASQLFIAGHNGDFENSLKQVKAKTLFLPSTNDLLLVPAMAKQVHDTLKARGHDTQYDEIPGGWGHLNGIFTIKEKADVLKSFLSE